MRLIAALALACSASASAAAEFAWRIEGHPLATVTIPGQRVLEGAIDGPPATIAGELRLPTGGGARVPAVIFLHGDAGAVSNQPVWIDALVEAGYAVLTLDSFTGRGALSQGPGIGPIPGSVGAASRIADAHRALALLARHPRIDPKRIALMGVSSGARTVTYSAMRRFARPFAVEGVSFAAFVALYPSCNVRLVGDDAVVDAPLRIYAGAADTITRASFCEAYVTRLRERGADAAITVYPEAQHGFDGRVASGMPGLPPANQIPNGSRCDYAEEAPGRLVNVATGKPPADDDACVERGLAAGPDGPAGIAVRSAVLAFFRDRL